MNKRNNSRSAIEIFKLLLDYYAVPLKITLLYAVLGSAWIFISDQLLKTEFVDTHLIASLTLLKGYFYVIVSSAIIFVLVSSGIARDRKRNELALDRSERALKESIKELADVQKALDESSIIAITDQRGIIKFVNDKFCEISQYTREELLGQDHRILNSGYHSKEFFKEMWRTIGTGGTWKNEIRNRAKDGSYYWVATTIVPFLNDKGRPYQYVAIRNDITERKLAEESLRESEERYGRLVELTPEAIIIHSNGVIRYANRACIKLLGASSLNQLIDLPVNRFAHPEFLDLTNERIETMKDIGVEIAPFEEKIVNLDGKILDVEVTGITINHEGTPAFLMIFRDITSRKKAEEALQQSEEQYRLIAENMSDLVGVVDTKGVVLYASPSYEHVLGYSPKEIEGNPGIELMHPDDMEKLKSKFKNRVTEMEDHSIEFRMKHKKGHWVWIEAHIKQLLDERNYVLRIQFVGRDISERKIFEEKLNYMAFYDALTGIPNRRLFQEKLMQIIKETNRYERKFAIIYMDIDDFKGINDLLGHDAGDELLKQFAKRVQNCLRESDTFARQGGDEFTILLCEIKEEQDAIIIAERILTALQKPWTINNYEFTTTSSLGVAFYPKDGTSFAELMKYADTAMYEAKEAGKNMIRVYNHK